MASFKDVPQRGDGFDTKHNTNINGPANQSLEGGEQAAAAPGGGVPGMLGKLSLDQITRLAQGDAKKEKILKDAFVGGGAGIGAIGARELNELLGDLVGEEWAGAIGGAFGGFLGGLASKQVKKTPKNRRSF
jgi:hypothetical protein